MNRATADDLRAVYEAWLVTHQQETRWMSPTAMMIRAILERYDVVPKQPVTPHERQEG
jgi:hypothetical protein